MLITGKVITDGLILTLLISVYLMGTIYYNPRFARHDLPKDIRDASPPLTKKEKWQALILTIPFLVMVIAIPFLSTLRFNTHSGGSTSFVRLSLHAFGVLLIAHVLELLLLDWLVYCTITPKFIVIP